MRFEAYVMAPSQFLDWGSLYKNIYILKNDPRDKTGVPYMPLNRLKSGAHILHSEDGSDNCLKLLSQKEVLLAFHHH